MESKFENGYLLCMRTGVEREKINNSYEKITLSSLIKYNNEKFIYIKYPSNESSQEPFYVVYLNENEDKLENVTVLDNSSEDKKEVHDLCSYCQMLYDDTNNPDLAKTNHYTNFSFQIIETSFDNEGKFLTHIVELAEKAIEERKRENKNMNV